MFFLGANESKAQEIIFKLKAEYNSSAKSSLIKAASVQSVLDEAQLNASPLFPNHSPLQKSELASGKVDISGIYKIEANSEEQALAILRKLKKDPHLEYVEMAPINQIVYQPNDTANYRQDWYLNSVQAFRAWDVEQGDTSVYVAILDTGSDSDHEDLMDNLYKNPNDPPNNIDDDGDGFVDNYLGWDVGNNNNTIDPDDGNSHGSQVAGISSASTDNVTGISGFGFDTRVMTVKVTNFSGQLVGAYQGIVYAADQNAPIINCSWGSYTFSQFAQDIVNYAAINKGSLVIGAAGNGPFSGPNSDKGIEDRFYPAAYENVFSVGALVLGDTVWRGSNYGYWLDIYAPGVGLYTTTNGGGYGFVGGTSMAAPVVAAAAALVKSHYPNNTAKQIEERLINSAVNIDASNESKYFEKVGAGKVDFYNALVFDSLPGIRMENISYSNGSSPEVFSGDSIFISGDFINYLEPSVAGNAQLEIMNGGAQAINQQISLAAIPAQGTIDNRQDPFIFKIDPNIGINQRLEFKLTINAGSYQKIQYFSTIVNNDYLTMRNDEMAVTVSSDGGLGFAGPSNSLGEGVRFREGSSLLYEGGLMMGNSNSYVVDKFRGEGGTDNDFYPLSLVREVNYAQAESATSTLFNDARFSSPANIEVEQTNYFYDSTYTENALLINYQIKNISGTDLNNFYAGLIADWDLISYPRNRVFYDDQRKMGISLSLDSSVVAGLMAISHPNLANHYAIDNQDNGAGGVNLSDGFDSTEKFTVLLGGRDSAGYYQAGGSDILDAISMGPFNISTDSSISLSFAVLVANDLNSLETAADSARSIYENFPIGLNETRSRTKDFSIFPNPANDVLNVLSKSNGLKAFDIEIYDLRGQLIIRKMVNTKQLVKLNIESLKNGVYLLRIIEEDQIFQDKFVVAN